MKRWMPDLLALLGLLLAPLVLPLVGFSQDTMNRILVFGLFGIGFDLLFGYTGLLSFGQSAFFGSGGFVTAYLLTQMNAGSIFLALMAGTLASAVIGFLVGLIALRRTGIYFAMITMAIAEVFFFMENSPLAEFTGGENGLPGVPSPEFHLGHFTFSASTGWNMYWFIACCYLLGLVLARRIVASPVGLIMVAIRDNPVRVAALGHQIHHYKLLVFVVAAAYGGFAGGLLGILQGYMPPEAFSFDTSGQLVMQTVIGGAGTLFGPLLGAAVWLYLRDFLQASLGLGATWKLVLGVVFVLLVCFLRRGLVGACSDLIRRFFRNRQTPSQSTGWSGAEAPLNPHGDILSAETAGPILEVRGLTKHYGGLAANDNIHFSVRAGELRGIIGPNGAGKSTFFKMLTCEVHPSSGTIHFWGRNITGLRVTEVCQLGLTKSYQINQLFSRLSVVENIIIAALARKRGPFRMDLLRDLSRVEGLSSLVWQTLALVNLTPRAHHLVSDLAYGEKRRLEIGLALATSPALLLLDEPLAGMSPQERANTVKMLKSIGRERTLIIIDHDMDALFELAERITVLREGTILVEGTPEDIRSNRTVQEAYLGGVQAS